MRGVYEAVEIAMLSRSFKRALLKLVEASLRVAVIIKVASHVFGPSPQRVGGEPAHVKSRRARLKDSLAGGTS